MSNVTSEDILKLSGGGKCLSGGVGGRGLSYKGTDDPPRKIE